MDSTFLRQFGVILVGILSDVDLFRINKICRSAEQPIVLFSSCSFGQEACFLADFGPKFYFHCDPPHNQTLKSISFPSVETALNTRWSLLGSRFFSLPQTYTRSRFLQNYYTSVTFSRIMHGLITVAGIMIFRVTLGLRKWTTSSVCLNRCCSKMV
jgi:hypothetical protein